MEFRSRGVVSIHLSIRQFIRQPIRQLQLWLGGFFCCQNYQIRVHQKLKLFYPFLYFFPFLPIFPSLNTNILPTHHPYHPSVYGHGWDARMYRRIQLTRLKRLSPTTVGLSAFFFLFFPSLPRPLLHFPEAGEIAQKYRGKGREEKFSSSSF